MNVQKLISFFSSDDPSEKETEYLKQLKIWDDAYSPARLMKDLPYMLKNKELSIYYQPIVDLEDEHIVGMEALIRWIHPKFGMLEPFEFMPLAEELGLMIDIGEWVLEKACYQLAQWKNQGLIEKPLKIAINLSSSQLKQQGFLSKVEEILGRTGTSKDSIELEFGHGKILDEEILASINKLSSNGLGVSIDDFGIGQYSWIDLNAFRAVKIDKSLVKNINNNENTKTYITKVLLSATKLGMKTFVAGIETRAELQFFKDIHCKYAQGFYFSKAVPASGFLGLFQSSNFKV
jgi:EAL domain-containing protein (putative c-di-GMP-specific phosphodiesterase class I)